VRGRDLAIAGGVAAGAVALIAALLASRDDRPPAPPPATRRTAVAPLAAAPRAPGLAAAPAAAPPALPGSLEGTEPDGAITADAGGHLVVDLELRRLFDHFLIASGEEPIAQIRSRILAVLHARLPAIAAGEAAAILEQYLAYRDAARLLTPPADPRAGLAQVHDLRARTFAPATARAFFAEEEAAIYAALDRRDALADPSLSAAARDRRVADIDARLPPAVRDARAAAAAPVDEIHREQAMRAAGASDAQIAAARSAALGADAAGRLAELDRTRAVWTARLDAFRAARAALLADARLADAERARRVAELLARSFSPEEQLRVEALDRISAPR
jgi:lipase chaperone LimK